MHFNVSNCEITRPNNWICKLIFINVSCKVLSAVSSVVAYISVNFHGINLSCLKSGFERYQAEDSFG